VRLLTRAGQGHDARGRGQAGAGPRLENTVYAATEAVRMAGGRR